MAAPVVFNSSPALPEDPLLRKQHLEDLITDIHGSFTFMQVKSEMFDFPPAGLLPFLQRSVSFRTLFWTANSRPPRAPQGEGDHRFSLLQVTNHKVFPCRLWVDQSWCQLLHSGHAKHVTYSRKLHAWTFSRKDRILSNLEVSVRSTRISCRVRRHEEVQIYGVARRNL